MPKMKMFSMLLPLILSGCMWSSFRETAYFDLSPKPVPKAEQMTVADFQNRSGAGSRFQYREANGRILTDPDNKWIMPPGALVANAIRRAAAPKQTEKTAAQLSKMRVSGELLAFEVELPQKEFHLYAVGKIKPENGKAAAWSRDIRIPLKDSSPESVVAAASQAVFVLAEAINRTGGR